ncbi:MAG: hypothetical protein ABIS27_11235, partial [Longimicrobiales bacterium]
MRKYVALAALVSIVASTGACDGRVMVEPDTVPGPNHDLVLAGNGHFFFRPPLASTQTTQGEFNPNLAPVVEVCHVTSSACEVVARFSTVGGTHGETIAVDEIGEQYAVNWQTASYGLQDGVYQISVRTASSQVGNTLLGTVDVDVTPTGRPVSSARPNINNGSNLAIKFRIEHGALCATAGCLETSVGGQGGTFTLEDSLAGAEFPAGAIPPGAGNVNLVVERFTDHSQACLPTNYPQFEGCYRFRTEPHVTFDELVTVGICLDPAAHAVDAQLELQKWDEVDPATLISLPRVFDIDFLDCADFQISQGPASLGDRLARAGNWLLSPLARVLTPAPVFAGVITPYGGKLSDFSRIGWVQPLQISALPAGTSALVGTALTPSPSIRVTSTRTGANVAGVPIAWTATVGGGSFSLASGVTDVSGIMATTWVLGSLPGANAAVAAGSNPRPFWP